MATMSEHQTRLQVLFDTMVEGVVLIAPDGQIMEANPAAERILGLSRSKITARKYTDPEWKIIRPDGTPMPAEETAGPRAMQEKRAIQNVVMGVERPDGSLIWLRVNASPLLNNRGGVEGVVGTFADVTASKHAEDRHRAILKGALDGFWVSDMEGRLLQVNDSYCRMVGYSNEELLAMSIPDIEDVETPEETARHLKKVAEQVYDRFETRHRCKDGTVIDVEISANYLDVEGGQVFVFVRDVTERKLAEEALEYSERNYRMLVESIPQKVFFKDINSLYISCNDKYAEDLNIEPGDIAGRTDYDFYPGELAEKYTADDRRIVESGQTERFEETYTVQGQERVVETYKTPVEDRDGNTVGLLGIFHDITEHKLADEALQRSEERFRTLANMLPQTVFEADKDGIVRFVNREGYHIFGYSHEDVARGIDVLQIVRPEDRGRAMENINLRRAGEELLPHEYMAMRKDGSTFPALVYAHSIIEGGRYAGVRGILIDITERRQTEEALRQSEERYRLIIDNTSDSIWALGPDLRMIYQSPSTKRLFGYTLEEWHKIDWGDYVHPDHLDAVTDLLSSFRGGQREGDATISVRVRDKHGKESWAEISASPVRGPDGEFAGVVGVTRDITERKEAEERLVEYRAAVEQSADGIAMSDLAGNIRFVNEAWARMHGYSVEELIGRHLSVFHTREQMESQVSPFNQRLREIGSQEGDVWHVRRNGEVFATRMTTTLLRRADGEPFGMFAFMRDITEQKELERQQRDREIAEARADELGKSRRRLIEAQESLRKDIASQLHGTVQNRLILLAHRLAELEARPESERTTEELAGIRHRLEELQRDHIRPISHRLFPSILRLGIAVGLESLVDEYSSQLPVDLRVSKNLRDGEQVDRRLVPDDVKLALYRVADEVLVNILKHTPTVSSVVMKLSLSDGGILRLTVSDDGSGFQKQSRSHGIGLALISDYAEAAGGICTVKSVPGKGTRVTAQVQLAETEAGRRRRGRTSG